MTIAADLVTRIRWERMQVEAVAQAMRSATWGAATAPSLPEPTADTPDTTPAPTGAPSGGEGL